MHFDELFNKRLLLNIGKGGVGRSTVTATLARLAAAQGKRVLVCEVNARAQMPALLGGSPPSEFDQLDHIWQIDDRIWATNVIPWPALKEYVSQVLKLKLLYNLVFKNKLVRYFLRAVPGLQELLFIGKIWYHVVETLPNGEPRFDIVMVDTPATGHALAMLRIPRVIVDTVPLGPMHKAAQDILTVLHDPALTAINLVTLPEEMPVNETIELHAQLKDDLKMPLGAMFLNQMPTAPYEAEQAALFQELLSSGLADQDAWPLFAAAQESQKLHCKASRYQQHLVEAVPLPLHIFPRLQQADEARTLLNGLYHHLQEAA